MEAQSSQLVHSSRFISSSPRLLLDGRKLGDGGIGVYIENTIQGLLARGDTRVTVISSREHAERFAWSKEVSWIYDSSKGYSFSEYFLLPRRVDFSQFDIFHAPHYTLPFGVSIPTVVTIHDLIHIEQPSAFYYPFIAKRLIRLAVARASKVIAVSADTRQALIKLTGADPAKIVHIPNAIPSFILDSHNAEPLSDAARPLMVSADERYFVAVLSNTKPHKGVADLLRAWPLFVERYMRVRGAKRAPRLVLAGYGADGIRSDQRFADLVKRAGEISIVGSVDNDLLRHLYRGADALIVPSLAEGFCLPALEAQGVGTRVVCRPVPAIKELITANDIVAASLSVESLGDAIFKCAVDSKRDKEIQRNHLERFALPVVAEQTRSVYASVLATERRLVRQDLLKARAV